MNFVVPVKLAGGDFFEGKVMKYCIVIHVVHFDSG